MRGRAVQRHVDNLLGDGKDMYSAVLETAVHLMTQTTLVDGTYVRASMTTYGCSSNGSSPW